jgi:hypothetical protein
MIVEESAFEIKNLLLNIKTWENIYSLHCYLPKLPNGFNPIFANSKIIALSPRQ